jgi:Zn-dependent protease with chaperone function
VFLAITLTAALSACSLRPALQLVPVTSPIRVTHTGGSYRASARITFSVRTVRKPVYSSDPGARAHIAGYYAIAQRLTQASEVESVGSTPAQARARLAKGVAALARDENLEYVRQVHVYDTVTDNGRAQSQGPAFGFPGGPNANAYCPL